MMGFALLLGLFCGAEAPPLRTLEYSPGPADNPLKGLVPYAGTHAGKFPHSMEFNYLPFSALVVGPQRHDWRALEKLLDDIASRRHQAVVRIYLEYPGKKNVIPEFLVAGGLKVHKYRYTETQPEPPAPIETPDYANPALRKELQAFVAAFGAKYDGDPRLAYVTAGLLGTWGEWHTYPRTELFAKKDVQAEVMDAYAAAFRKTPVLLRYPAGDRDEAHAANAERPFGYHDDSFAWATLDTGRHQDDWFFVPALKAAGPAALAKWQTQPIGGEIRPEAWGKVFDEKPPTDKRIQNFRRCVDETHATWQMDSGMFNKPQSAARIKNGIAEVRRMGYDLHVAKAGVAREGAGVRIAVELENRGVAPLYYDWPLEYGALDAAGKLLKTFPAAGKAAGLLPGAPARTWTDTVAEIPANATQLALRVKNPLPTGLPVRFANREQDAVAPGWLVLGAAR